MTGLQALSGARIREKHIPRQPSKPSKGAFGGFEGDRGKRFPETKRLSNRDDRLWGVVYR
jgi:hypothetical protein